MSHPRSLLFNFVFIFIKMEFSPPACGPIYFPILLCLYPHFTGSGISPKSNWIQFSNMIFHFLYIFLLFFSIHAISYNTFLSILIQVWPKTNTYVLKENKENSNGENILVFYSFIFWTKKGKHTASWLWKKNGDLLREKLIENKNLNNDNLDYVST